jgi:Mn2+/Fe2+ NRAMP family transporter
MISTLSEMYSGPFGNWTKVVFLVGAGAVLFKTLYLACAANSRLMVDFLGVVETMPDQSESNRNRWIARFCVGFPVLALTFYVFQRDPQLMVKVGGLAQAATLPMIALVTLFFRYKRLTSTISPGKAWDLCLWIATAAIVSVAIYSIPDSLRQIWAIL